MNLIGANLDEIVLSIRANTAINNYFNGKIYGGLPTKELEGRYMYLFTQPENINGLNASGELKYQTGTVTFLIVGEDASETDAKLYEIIGVLVQELESTCQSYNKNYGTFEVQKVTPNLVSPVMRTKNRPRIQIDFLFNYIA